MSLNDIDSSTHCWYYNVNGNLDNSYNVGETENDFAVAGAEPIGRVNTERMIASWNSSQYGAQNEDDIWGLIQDEVARGWFVASKSEWSAFGSALNITSSNASMYGLMNHYWTSSQNNRGNAYTTNCNNGNIGLSNVVNDYGYVRLATIY